LIVRPPDVNSTSFITSLVAKGLTVSIGELGTIPGKKVVVFKNALPHLVFRTASIKTAKIRKIILSLCLLKIFNVVYK